jgi:predicted dienelactone hydrolase
MEHICVVGYSYGGYTALASAGAQIDFTPMHSWCKQNADDKVVSAGVGYFIQCVADAPAEEKIKAELGVKVGTGELWPAFDVKGVDAIVPLAPFGIIFTSGGAKSITVPTLLMAGSGDSLLPIDFNAAAVYKDLSSKYKSLVVFDRAGHGIFANKADDYLMKHGWYEFTSDLVWDMDRAHDLINHFTTAFLLDVLKGDKDAHKALLPDAVKFPGIEYQTTMK